MIYLAILLAAVLIYIVQMKLYEKKTRDGLSYSVRLGAEEVFEDEDIFYYDELVNDKLLPLPFLKVNSDLPQGLYFHFLDPVPGSDVLKESHEAQVQSMRCL